MPTSSTVRPSPATAAVVINATQFNPSVFSQVWLERFAIAKVEELLPDSIFSAQVVQVTTLRFRLLVMPDNLQLFPIGDLAFDGGFVSDFVGKVVNTLPHVPYRAVGINFGFQTVPVDNLEEYSRRNFAPPGAVFEYFDQPGARFGTYASRDVGFARLKLTVLPVNGMRPDGVVEEIMQSNFNFHRDLSGMAEESTKEIEATVGNWEKALNIAASIAEKI